MKLPPLPPQHAAILRAKLDEARIAGRNEVLSWLGKAGPHGAYFSDDEKHPHRGTGPGGGQFAAKAKAEGIFSHAGSAAAHTNAADKVEAAKTVGEAHAAIKAGRETHRASVKAVREKIRSEVKSFAAEQEHLPKEVRSAFAHAVRLELAENPGHSDEHFGEAIQAIRKKGGWGTRDNAAEHLREGARHHAAVGSYAGDDLSFGSIDPDAANRLEIWNDFPYEATEPAAAYVARLTATHGFKFPPAKEGETAEEWLDGGSDAMPHSEWVSDAEEITGRKLIEAWNARVAGPSPHESERQFADSPPAHLPPELLAAMIRAAYQGDAARLESLTALGSDPDGLRDFLADTSHDFSGLAFADGGGWTQAQSSTGGIKAVKDGHRSLYGAQARAALAWQDREDKGIAHPEHPVAQAKRRRLEKEPLRQTAREAWRTVAENPGSVHPDELPALAEHLNSLTRDELKLTLRGLAKSAGGLKSELVDKLLDHVAKPGLHAGAGPKLRPNGSPESPATKDVFTLDPAKLKTDPQRFQYKVSGIRAGGVGDELKGTSKWNPELGGTLLVWRDPADGQDYVINGHHRHELAQRVGAEAVNVRYIDAKDAVEARARGALANIAEGRGTATDAAKYLRDTGKDSSHFKEAGISMSGKVAADAEQLKDLSDKAFQRLTTGDLKEGTAVAVAKHLKDPKLQDKLFGLLDRREEEGKDWSASHIENAARKMAKVAKVTETGSDLFGDFEDEQDTFQETNDLETFIAGKLAQKVNDFAAVSNAKRADRVAEAGNTIAVDENAKRRDKATGHAEDFEREKDLKSETSAAVREGAVELKKAKTRKEKDAVKQRTLEAVQGIHDRASGGSVPPVAGAGGASGGGDAGTDGTPVAVGEAHRPDESEAGDGGVDDRTLSPEDAEDAGMLPAKQAALQSQLDSRDQYYRDRNEGLRPGEPDPLQGRSVATADELRRATIQRRHAENPRDPMHHSEEGGHGFKSVGMDAQGKAIWAAKVNHPDAREGDTATLTTRKGVKRTVRLGKILDQDEAGTVAEIGGAAEPAKSGGRNGPIDVPAKTVDQPASASVSDVPPPPVKKAPVRASLNDFFKPEEALKSGAGIQKIVDEDMARADAARALRDSADRVRIEALHTKPLAQHTAGKKNLERTVAENEHRHSVEAAMKAGKPVSADVLKDYPDLAEESDKHTRMEAYRAATGAAAKAAEPPVPHPNDAKIAALRAKLKASDDDAIFGGGGMPITDQMKAFKEIDRLTAEKNAGSGK